MEILNKENLIKVLILWFPISFLMIKHGVHISLYALLLLFTYEIFGKSVSAAGNKKTVATMLSLSGIFLATVIQQSITFDINFSAWDGPSRLLIAGLTFLYLRQKNINYTKILEIAIPLGLILLWAYLNINQKYYWGARWANSFVDPNSLGSQSTILAMICLLSITLKTSPYITILKILGAICGVYISIKSESRGAWVSIPFMSICWIIIQMKQPNFWENKKQALRIIAAFLLLIFGVITISNFIDPVRYRLLHTIYEITMWFKDPTIYTSAGARMSMWAASIQLIGENLLGYGEIGIKDILKNHPLYQSIHLHGMKDMVTAGPHSDILSKGLSLGIFGLISYALTIFVPAIIFWSKIRSQEPMVKKSAYIGLIYLSGVFTVGLFNETLSLKYLCSFYGLLIACLAADVLRDNSSSYAYNQKVS